MEAILQEHHNQMPVREILMSLADKFRYALVSSTTLCCMMYSSFFFLIRNCKQICFGCSESAERKGKIVVQFKQVRSWILIFCL